jgi:2-C-methyl-D-erythritol 4-phosphate cytidylyltransferase
MRVSAVILAAGRGRRMGGDANKVFLSIAGEPLLVRTFRAFVASERIDEIVLVVGPGEEARVRDLLPAARFETTVVPGGAMRRDSAIAGVEAAYGEIVLIHDGARPFPSPELIERVIVGAVEHGACVPTLPVIDTLRRGSADGSLSAGDIERCELVRIQTPQGFRTSLIRRALALAPPDAPDDASAVLVLGEVVWPVAGEPTNLKVTVPEDLPLAEAVAGIRRRDVP